MVIDDDMEILKNGPTFEKLKRELDNPNCEQWIKDWIREIESS